MRQVVLPSKAVFKRAAACFISIFLSDEQITLKQIQMADKDQFRGFLNISKNILNLTFLLFFYQMVIINFYTNIYLIAKGLVIFLHRCVSNGKMPKVQEYVGSKGIVSMWEGQLMSGALNCKFIWQDFTRISKQLLNIFKHSLCSINGKCDHEDVPHIMEK